jgi:hypothetical protein
VSDRLLMNECVDYRLCTTLIMHQQLRGYKVEEKIYLGVKS